MLVMVVVKFVGGFGGGGDGEGEGTSRGMTVRWVMADS